MFFIQYMPADTYQGAGYAICTHGRVVGQRTPCVNVLESGFTLEREAIAYLDNNRAELVDAHREMEACMPSLQELNSQLIGRRIDDNGQIAP